MHGRVRPWDSNFEPRAKLEFNRFKLIQILESNTAGKINLACRLNFTFEVLQYSYIEMLASVFLQFVSMCGNT